MPEVDVDILRHAIQLISARSFDQAETVLARALDEAPEDDEALVLMGLCQHGQKGPAAGLPFFERAVQANDGSVNAHYYRGRMLQSLGQLHEAREALAQSLALNPNFVEARTVLGTISLQQGQLERAASELRTALRANEGYVPALSVLARVLVQQDELDEAEKIAIHAIRLQPENPAAQEAMAFVFVKQGRDDFAEQCLRNALDKMPDNAEFHASLADILMRRRRHREALPHFAKALSSPAVTAKTAFNMSISLARTGDLQQAWQLLEQAHQRWPDDQGIRIGLAEYCVRGGQADAAQTLIDELDANRFDVRMIQINIQQALGHSDQAIALTNQIIEFGTDEEVRHVRLLKANLASQSNDLDTAQQAIEPLLQASPPDAEAVLAWVQICRRSQRYDLALKPVQQMLDQLEDVDDPKADQDRAQLHQLLAELHESLDQPEQALRHLGRTSWRRAPMTAILQEQSELGSLDKWLKNTDSRVDASAPDDGLPAPIIVAGWPGSGRELILPMLMEAADQLIVLDSDSAKSRREALGLPSPVPEMVLDQHESVQLTARKRYMRGLDRNQLPRPVLDTSWYEMSAIPALAMAFPGVTVIWPECDPRDLELHFRFCGYQDVPMLMEQLAEEKKLAKRLSQQLPVKVISIDRCDLFHAPEQIIAKLAEGIGIEAVPGMQERLDLARANTVLLPDERWRAYQPLFLKADS